MDEQLDMTARLLLGVAMTYLRTGEIDSYILGRLRVRGLDAATVQRIVDTLADVARDGALCSAQVEVGR